MLLPILPLSISNHVKAQQQVSHGMHDHTSAQRFRTEHPEVINKSGNQTDIPIRPMLDAEKNGGEPKGKRCESSQRDPLKVMVNEPAHEPGAPKEFFGNGDDGSGSYRSPEEDAVAFERFGP